MCVCIEDNIQINYCQSLTTMLQCEYMKEKMNRELKNFTNTKKMHKSNKKKA